MKAKKNMAEWIFALLPSIFVVSIPVISAELVIRNLGGIIGAVLPSDTGGKYDFALIFAQTADARLLPHVLLPLLFGMLFAEACFYVFPKIKSKALSVVLGMLLFLSFVLTGSLCSLLFTYVNGIRFCDLLAELLPIIDKL